MEIDHEQVARRGASQGQADGAEKHPGGDKQQVTWELASQVFIKTD